MKHLKRRGSSLLGFTIVELLIVIVIIAILATISIVAYNGIQSRAKASEASYALAQAKKKLELYRVDNGSYPTSGNLASAGVTDKDVSYEYTSDGNTYCITGTAGSVSYKASESTNPSAGGCAGHGQNGSAAITNLSPNPSLESGSGGWTTNSWGMGGAGTTSMATGGGASGSNSYRLTFTTTPTSGQPYISATSASVTVGQSYCFSVSVRPSWSGVFFDTVLEWRDASNVWISGVAGSSTAAPPGVWTKLSACGTVPAGISNVLLLVRRSGGTWPPANATWDTDAVMLTQSTSAQNYADGNTIDWTWNGTVNLSTSTGPPQ